ncbi:MAG TPA: TIGR03435 family protein, partial [Desulfuromonadaceae bacterium]|nr:TIGR03435 family protein [Desulfuromonadaceae bacterium]
PRIYPLYHIPVPPGRYDFIDTTSLLNGDALKTALQRDLGIIARYENVETNVLALVLKQTNAPGIKLSRRPGSSGGSHSSLTSVDWAHEGESMSQVAGFVESIFRVPVVDHTGLTNRYDLKLSYPLNQDGTADKDGFKKAILDQLGIDIVPAREPIEYLVVDKAQ